MPDYGLNHLKYLVVGVSVLHVVHHEGSQLGIPSCMSEGIVNPIQARLQWMPGVNFVKVEHETSHRAPHWLEEALDLLQR